MGKRKSSTKFSSIWFTQGKLGEYFDLSAREVGQHLIELGLRIYDANRSEYAPTEKARAEGYCAYTPLRSGTPFFLWHRHKVGALLQERTGREPWSDLDIEAQEMARDLIATAREAERGYDKLFYLTYDEIPKKKSVAVKAWAIWLTRRRYPGVHQMFRELVTPDEVIAIEHALLHIADYRTYTVDDLQYVFPLYPFPGQETQPPDNSDNHGQESSSVEGGDTEPLLLEEQQDSRQSGQPE